MHQRFTDAINQDPDDRATQLIYADWLDQQGDPRAEAWRVLIEAGKRPEPYENVLWWWSQWAVEKGYRSPEHSLDCMEGTPLSHQTFYDFFAAMDAAAVAWVRRHRDPEFLMWEVCDFCKGSGQTTAVDGVTFIDGKRTQINPRPAACMCCEGTGRCRVGDQIPPGELIR